LKWVQNNIEKFGVDPKIGTLFGRSAGVGLHILSPMSKGNNIKLVGITYTYVISSVGFKALEVWSVTTKIGGLLKNFFISNLMHYYYFFFFVF